MDTHDGEDGGRFWKHDGVTRFRCRRLLGSGSLGVVYHVYDAEMAQDVALKTLPHFEADRLYHIKEEFRSLADIRHPNLVELYELFVEAEDCFFTMALVDGIPFTEYVRTALGAGGGAPVGLTDPAISTVYKMLAQLAQALCALHSEGKIHRDIKPTNVLVTAPGRTVVLDFDMVTRFRIDDPRDAVRELAGTADYAAPEQLWSEESLSPAADWYAAGVMLFESLAGRLPFEGSFRETLHMKELGKIPRLREIAPGVPPELEALVERLMHPEPSRRAGAADILEVVRAADRSFAHTDLAAWTSSAVSPVSPPFVGRKAEMARLLDAFGQAEHGKLSVAFVEGASGIGKTALVRHFQRTICADPRALVLSGACHPQEAVPYKAFDGLIDRLSRYLESLSAQHLREILPDHISVLTRLFPVLRRVQGLPSDAVAEETVEPRELRLRSFRALRSLLAKIAERHTLVLWIDDLQWSDADSMPLFRELLRPPDAPALLLVLSYREQTARVQALKDQLDGVPQRKCELKLGPLSEQERTEFAAQMLAHMAGRTEPLIEEIARESAGSPFFLTELARHVTESPADAVDGGSSEPRLARILRERFEKLTPEARGILEIVAVAGKPMERSVVLRAAGLAGSARLEILRLTQNHLLRYAESGERRAIMTYHDRIREAVIDVLSPQARKSCHLRIASALQILPSPDPEALMEHYRGAGDERAAGTFALEAARRAEDALAFDRAAELYRMALEHAGDQEAAQRWRLCAKIAEALANAGRGAEAAKSFESAALLLEEHGDADAAFVQDTARDLRRQAAEYFLRSGHVDRGIALLRKVLHAVGLDYPASHGRALAQWLLYKTRLALRGHEFQIRNTEEIPKQLLAQVETCWSAGLGLAWVDRIRTSCFGARYTLLALDAGDRLHVTRALAAEASELAALGGSKNRTKSASLLATAKQLAMATTDVRCVAFVTLLEGSIAFYDARWILAFDLCQRGQQLVRERPKAAAWEMTTSYLLSLAALVYLGRFAELRRLLPALVVEAQDRGDRLAASSLATGLPNMTWLASDEPDEARRHADAAMDLWKQRGFQFQHYLDLIARTHIDLYCGDAWAAWERLDAMWPTLHRTFHFVVQNFRVTLLHLRARAALAAATLPYVPRRGLRGKLVEFDRARLLRIAQRDATRIATEDVAWAPALGAGLLAGVAAARGKVAETIETLDHAAQAFEELDMALHAAAAHYRRGIQMGGEAGGALCAASEQRMRREGIAAPARFSTMLVPGTGSP